MPLHQPPRPSPEPTRAMLRKAPRCWLMTDARLGAAMPAIIAAMPPRSAIVVRPYALNAAGRHALIRAIRRAARAKRHLLLLSGRGSASGYDGRHAGGRCGTIARSGGWLSVPVHDRREAERARRWRANAVLVSPIWPTASHALQPGIGLSRMTQLARISGCTAIALGGMTITRFTQARRHGAQGWAAISAWG